jgi:GNAT superfamily N-acetyltransferase
MSLPADTVVAASNDWIWIPEYATTAETDEYTLIRFPDYFDHPLELVRFQTARRAEPAVEDALARARGFGLPELHWMVRLDSPPAVTDVLLARGATVEETLDVLARDLSDGTPELPPPTASVELRWATDVDSARDAAVLSAAVFGGSVPPGDRLAEIAERDETGVPKGEGGTVVAYADGVPAGSGGVTMAGDVARLWGGGVAETARGQGVYRAVLGARLEYAAAHGARMALVKGRVQTSGPILRRAGFTAYGQELLYKVPLGS